MRDDTPVLVGTLAGLVVAWVLRLVGVYQGWGMVIAMSVITLVGALAARFRAEEATEREREVPLEWVGVTVPWTPDRLVEVDRALNLEQFEIDRYLVGERAAP
jgi:hypothetical protein